jgi:hypothetical protein
MTKKDQGGPIPPGGRRASASLSRAMIISSQALAALFNFKNNFQQWCLLISINTTNVLIIDLFCLIAGSIERKLNLIRAD